MLSLRESTAGIQVHRFGLKSYQEIWEQQRHAQATLISQEAGEALFIGEHLPTITLGKGTKPGHVLVEHSLLEQRKIALYEVERGGDVTFHGPGQLVAYPILDLRVRKRDVNWYMRLLEQAIIDTLSDFAIKGERIPGKTGVWVASDSPTPRKIASLGVRISRWCTMHGLSLNVGSRKGEFGLEEGFALINPCGLGEVEITSMAKEVSKAPSLKEVGESLERNLLHHFL